MNQQPRKTKAQLINTQVRLISEFKREVTIKPKASHQLRTSSLRIVRDTMQLTNISTKYKD